MKCIFVGDLEDDAGFVAEVFNDYVKMGGIEMIPEAIEVRLLFMIYSYYRISRMNWLILSIESNNPETVQKLFSWQLEKEPTHQLLISC